MQISCVSSQRANLSTRTATIQLDPGEDVVCVFINVLRQPDGLISKTETGTYKGNNIYSATPLESQTERRVDVLGGQTYSFFVKVQNDCVTGDKLRVGGTELGNQPERHVCRVLREWRPTDGRDQRRDVRHPPRCQPALPSLSRSASPLQRELP